MSNEKEDPIKHRLFADVPSSDRFFDSLREAYPGFDDWYLGKAASGERAWFAFDDAGSVIAMLYLKPEDGQDTDIEPVITGKRLKIGTFKVDFDHHTSIGKRLLARALRKFAVGRYEYAYVTMFDADNTKALRGMLQQYGFSPIGVKGEEEVWAKHRPDSANSNGYQTFPFIAPDAGSSYILSILPEYHKRMFGDVDLHSEKAIPVPDSISVNTIEKVYLSAARNAANIKPGDHLAIYRTSDRTAQARYRSVISSICTATGVRHIATFSNEDEFRTFIKGRSVFSDDELHLFWTSKKYPWVISMLFDFPLQYYPIRKRLIEENIIAESQCIVCEPIDDLMLRSILKLGEVDEGYVID
ncbi:hypothetical protein [Bifidobacterium pseudolongum]|uniref:hypothetical protein n=1 Tax=Bifidobacterium pseudolongum TaxID=1694 RepID=UPI001C3E1D62|nr:hypothetical protein [Bifidobacterium pseudolongum]